MRRLPAVLVLVLVLAVSACGGSDTDIETSTDGAEDVTSVPTGEPHGADATEHATEPTAEISVVPTVSVGSTSVVTPTPATTRGGRALPDGVEDDASTPDGSATATPDARPVTTPDEAAHPSATPSPVAGPTGTADATPTPAAATFTDPTATTTASPTATRPPPTVTAVVPSPTAVPSATPTRTPTAVPPTPTVVTPVYFRTLPPGSSLPSGAECAALVRADPSPETHPANAGSNSRSGGPQVLIDGAEGFRGDSLATRISGNFTGTTEEILRWVACKWGFDEDITRARAWTESSWRIGTQGDQTDDAADCAYLGLGAPCYQSYGLLQVKGTVHEGTYPHSFQSTAWGVDYAMAWQRACFEGAFTWLDDKGYGPGDLNGCVGAWYSGEWYDEGATRYLGDVQANLAAAPWG